MVFPWLLILLLSSLGTRTRALRSLGCLQQRRALHTESLARNASGNQHCVSSILNARLTPQAVSIMHVKPWKLLRVGRQRMFGLPHYLVATPYICESQEMAKSYRSPLKVVCGNSLDWHWRTNRWRQCTLDNKRPRSVLREPPKLQ